VQGELESFLAIEYIPAPDECFDPDETHGGNPPAELKEKTSELKFIIALLPDPAHTHASVLFDQFTTSIQEGAQDEKFDFHSSWLPWDHDESSYPLLVDQKTARREKEFEENQPGIVLFRKSVVCSDDNAKTDCKKQAATSDSQGLIVFVVGEEATEGIHKEQFQHALDWIAWLQAREDHQIKNLAILGPTFSGSFPSLAHTLADRKTAERLGLAQVSDGPKLAIYSGSTSSGNAARSFQNTFKGQVVFHSFVQNDDEILRRFCMYMQYEQPGFDPSRVAIISEDETAYGGAVSPTEDKPINEQNAEDVAKGRACREKGLQLYYPRDISALRGAYQTRSLFDTGSPTQTPDAQKGTLPSDLADPTGKVHDSIRSYGGNQTPLAQEAFMTEIVAALRELQARYIILRSSLTLDQLFLANFLRRSYPDARLVILGSDLIFIRERGSTGLSGAMTLSNYPLFPLERDWTEHQSLPASDRTFSSDTAEGTYIAFRLVLNDMGRKDGTEDAGGCHVLDPTLKNPTKKDPTEDGIFVPRIYCTQDPPIPDYSPPFWMLGNQCGEFKDSEKVPNTGEKCPYLGPATWLSVIGVNRFWPIASLTDKTPHVAGIDPRAVQRLDDRKDEPGGRPEMPVGMKLFLVALGAFAGFHALCCGSGSYTAKPVFRSHFASAGDMNQTGLVLGGSCCVAFLAIVAGWGSGLFSIPAAGLAFPWFGFGGVTVTWLLALAAVLAHNRRSQKLAEDFDNGPPDTLKQPRMTDKDFTAWLYRASGIFCAASILFYLLFILPVQLKLLPENRVLASWRSMHLISGVSAIVPIFCVLIGLYLSFWFTLHGLALFGPDRPCLPKKERLAFRDQQGTKKYFLKMFSDEDAAKDIEEAAKPFNWTVIMVSAGLSVLFLVLAFGIGKGVPVRSLSTQNYSIIFLVWLSVCCSLLIVESWRLYYLWDELRCLLAFLDRLPLRRTMASLRGFSWGSVWKMSGNVLEVRYKVISRQMECMNHTIATLREFLDGTADSGAWPALAALLRMRRAGMNFGEWYSDNYKKPAVGNLYRFTEFQEKIAAASGALLSRLLVPAWRLEESSLLVAHAKDDESATVPPPAQPEDPHTRNAEEFVCLNYLSFIQNILGRLRTMAITIIVLFLASACAMSSYPFDPRQGLSAVLIVLFIVTAVVIVMVYADMHRDATLSHVTNTRPGELGAEFWFKIIGFGLAPLIGLITRIFPAVTDFLFTWLQPSISSLK